MNLETLQKGLDILFLLKDYSMMSVPEIALDLSLPPSSVYRYIKNLKARGLVADCEKQGYYGLGPKIAELAAGPRGRPNISDIARPVLQSLQKETGETILLNAKRGHKVVNIELVESDQDFRVSTHRNPMFMHAGAVAKVIMAYLPESEQDRIIREGLPKLTRKTITDPKKLRSALRRIRKDGYCVSAGELVSGTRGIAAPILDEQGKVIGCLSLIGPAQRVVGSKIPRFTKMVVEAAKEIARRIKRAADLVDLDQVVGQDYAADAQPL